VDQNVIAELDLEAAQKLLAPMTAQERIRWAVDAFGEQAVLLSSMQKTASVLIHIFHTLGVRNEILFGDTGFHFHETLKLRDDFVRKYGVNIVTLYPAMTPEQQEAHYGRKLHMFVDGQPECCRIRKEEPFLSYVRENQKNLVIIGVRRTDGGRRANVQAIGRDPRVGPNAFSLHPLFDWTNEMVEGYLKEHDVLVHPLHAQSYPSIGCACCTTPVAPGESPRAGRWRHLRKDGDGPQFCGINFTDGSGI
jgi:phosphoadenosine phosphosulfate reductase